MANFTLYKLDEVAEMLGLTKRTLYSYVKDGRLKAVKIGKFWRVSEENLQDFIQKGSKRPKEGKENAK